MIKKQGLTPFYLQYQRNMFRNNSNVVIFVLVGFLTISCAFDPPNGKLLELGKNYYVSYESTMSNDGIEIIYSFKKNIYQIVASNCISIYKDSNIIMLSKNLCENDTTYFEYYIIDKNSKTELNKISKILFESKIYKLEKIIENE